MSVRALHGDSRDVVKGLADASVDSVCTDPPYGIAFMGRAWDAANTTAFDPEFWAEIYRVLKPGAHLVAFGGTRTYHRLACAIEDAGFEIRDQLAWTFGAGFPKSHNVGKAIDKAAGAEREVIGRRDPGFAPGSNAIYGAFSGDDRITAPATAAARQWDGWGTALKPSYEPVVLAQKPYTPQQHLAILVPTIGRLICKVASSERTDTLLFGLLRANGFLSTATSLNSCLAALSGSESRFTTETASALTIDLRILKSSLSRITQAITIRDASPTNGGECDASLAAAISRSVLAKCERLAATSAGEIVIDWLAEEGSGPGGANLSPLWEPICLARKPIPSTVAANVLQHGTGALNIDGCRIPGAVKYFDHFETGSKRGYDGGIKGGVYGGEREGRWPANLVHDGSDEVMAEFAKYGESQSRIGKPRAAAAGDGWGMTATGAEYANTGSAARFFFSAKAGPDDRCDSKHPTVKPVALMRWLARLVTPPGGLMLDPFAGSGTTGVACIREGFDAILIEREAEYHADILHRIAKLSGLDAPLFAGMAV